MPLDLPAEVCYTEENSTPLLGTARVGRAWRQLRRKTAQQLTRSGYGEYNFLIGMTRTRPWNTRHILGGGFGGKTHLLMYYTGHPDNTADPWYAYDFEITCGAYRKAAPIYQDIIHANAFWGTALTLHDVDRQGISGISRGMLEEAAGYAFNRQCKEQEAGFQKKLRKESAMQFIITAHDGENVLDKRMAVRPRHLEGMAKLGEHIVCAGGLLDDEGKMKGSVLILNFEDRAALDNYLKNEPYVAEHVWEKIEIETLNVVIVNGKKVSG